MKNFVLYGCEVHKSMNCEYSQNTFLFIYVIVVDDTKSTCSSFEIFQEKVMYRTKFMAQFV